MKRLLLIFALAFCINAIFAQDVFVGGSFSVNQYSGDIPDSKVMPGVSGHVSVGLTEKFMLRGEVGVLKLKADDYSFEKNEFGRPAPFTNTLASVSITPIYQFNSLTQEYWSPYVLAGLKANMGTQGSFLQMAIPVGAGILYSPKKENTVQYFAEAVLNYGLTDGLDGYYWKYTGGKDCYGQLKLGVNIKL